MEEVYDVIVDKSKREINYCGITYKLANVSKKGDQFFYEYKASGFSTIIVVPAFRQQWEEAKKLIAKAGKGKSLAAYEKFIKTYIDKSAKSEEAEDDDGKPITQFTALYKDIKLEIVFDGKGLSLLEAFTIKKNNIFGEGIRVDFQGE